MRERLPFAPEQASEFAVQYDLLLAFVTALTVFFSVLVLFLIVYFGFKYRRGSAADRTRPMHHNTPLEAGTIVVLFFLAMGTFAWAAKLYSEQYNPPDDAYEVFVIGKQWMWHLQHPNGVRENNTLHIPVNQPVKLTMISQDVIHSFYIPAFRMKRDVMPGYYTSFWFTPTKPGKYRLFCAEYCGTQHSVMGGWIYVMETSEFQNWLASGGARVATADTAASGAGDTMATAGAALFQERGCATCHAADTPALRCPPLEGLFGKDVKLANGQTVEADEAYIRESILNPNKQIVAGYQPIMPAYQGQLSEEQILQLIAFIKSLQDAKAGDAREQIAAATAAQSGGNPEAARTESIQADFMRGSERGSVIEGAPAARTESIQADFMRGPEATR